jgi:endo-1,4-beta-xylanase
MQRVLRVTSSIVVLLLATRASAQTTLKDAYQKYFLIGAALNQSQISGENVCELPLIDAQFNLIRPENVLKWSSLHPEPNHYDFKLADRYVEFGQKHHQFIVGHTLIWHNQTPVWVFQDATGKPVDRNTLLARMRDHILTVVGRYKGRINAWDVVNEALADDGSLRQSPWLKIIGEDYLLKAYQFAHEADPQAQLYYNDYSLENGPKRAGAIALLQKLQWQGVHIAAVGLQGHYRLDSPSTREIDDALTDFSRRGLKMTISELDVDVLPPATHSVAADINLSFELQARWNPYTNGLPDFVQQTLANRYADLFALFLKHRDSINSVSFWGVTDANSWLDAWPVKGRTNYPLLFDRNCQPKPAFNAVIQAAHPQSPTK